MARPGKGPVLLLAAVLVSALPVAAQPLPTPAPTLHDPIFPGLGQPGLDVRHYDVALTVAQPGTPQLSGVVTLTLAATRPLTEVRLDFFGPTVTAVRWNGQPAPFRVEPEAQKLAVTPPSPLRPGQQARLTVEYQGTPGAVLDPDFSTPVELGWQTVPAEEGRAGANFTLSEPNGTHTFLPCNDHPSDKATFTTHVTVPAGYTAAASGLEGAAVEDRSVEGRGTWTFVPRPNRSPPMPWPSR